MTILFIGIKNGYGNDIVTILNVVRGHLLDLIQQWRLKLFQSKTTQKLLTRQCQIFRLIYQFKSSKIKIFLLPSTIAQLFNDFLWFEFDLSSFTICTSIISRWTRNIRWFFTMQNKDEKRSYPSTRIFALSRCLQYIVS